MLTIRITPNTDEAARDQEGRAAEKRPFRVWVMRYVTEEITSWVGKWEFELVITNSNSQLCVPLLCPAWPWPSAGAVPRPALPPVIRAGPENLAGR